MNLYVDISGLPELQSKADDAGLIAQPAQQVIEAIGYDLSTPKGGGMGVQVNSLALSVSGMAAVITTSLIWPRTQGTSWAQRTSDDFDDVANAKLQELGSKITQAWG